MPNILLIRENLELGFSLMQGAIKHMSRGYVMGSKVNIDLGRNHRDMGRASISSRKGRQPVRNRLLVYKV